jgi:hypothetical protein
MNETTEQALFDVVLQPLVCDSFWTTPQQDEVWQFATFTIHLPEPLLLEGAPGEPVAIGVNLDGFDAEVLLTLNPALGRIKKQQRGGGEERWYYAASELEVTISRREVAPEGKAQQEHFKAVLLPEYQAAAIEAANRSATFLKYRLWSSLFAAIERFSSDYGDDGSGRRDDISQRRRFSITPMAEQLQDAQQAYRNGHYGPELADALLVAAQQSILDQRLRRACLELTMACEAAIKRRIAAPEQLTEAIDDNFKSRHQAAYTGLNTLFQARDEVGGDAGFFRFTSTQRRDLRREQLKEWGASVTCLKNWLARIGQV